MAKNTLIKETDRLYQETMRLLYKDHCMLCGIVTEAGATHHLVKRTVKTSGLRWAVLNGVYVCSLCHQWAEEHPEEFLKTLNQKDPDRFWFYDRNKYTKPKTVSEDDIRGYRDQLKTLKESLLNFNCFGHR